MKVARGFTLTELIITIVIVGILAMITMPMLSNTIEIGNGNRAITNLRMIAASAAMWFNDTGTAAAQADANLAAINLRFTLMIQDPNFTYTGIQAGQTYTFTATRNGGAQNGATITINQTGAIGGTWPFL